MYEAYYGFAEKPFNLTPDPKYLYLSRRHTEAFAHLEFGRRERGGFAVVTGEVGTGKTTLARYFLSRLDPRTATAVVLYPAVTAAELLRTILDDLHVPAAGESLKDLVDALHRFLLDARREAREVVLLIDEAQDLSPEVLEQIRLISNLETDTEKLIQIVLMGQSEFQEMLSRRELRQLAQRVTARYHLDPLSREETEEYVRHRLEVAGGAGKVAFTTAALDAVHGFSHGIPRLINVVCDRALLGGYVQGVRTLSGDLVRRAAREVRGEVRTGRRGRRRLALLATGAAVAGAGLLALWSVAFPTVPARASVAAAIPAAPVQAPSPTSTPGTFRLDPVLLALPREASWRAALAEVQALWGGAPLQQTALRTHMEQVRRLDLPVVLEMFLPSRRESCFVALMRLQGDTAILSTGADTRLHVPVAEVDRLWTRQAVFLWRDFDTLGLSAPPERTASWTRDALARLGYLGPEEADLGRALLRFQQDAELAPDGVVGARTLMVLYSLGDYPRPRLQGGAS